MNLSGGHEAAAVAVRGAAVPAGIGAAVTRAEDHRAGQAAIGEAIGKAEKGRRGGHL